MSPFKRTSVALNFLSHTYLRFIAFALLFLLSIDGAFAQLATERLPKDDLMLFRNKDNQIASIKTLADWQQRRQSIVEGMRSIMGQLPADSKRCPLDMRIEEEIDGGSYVRRLITYESEPGCRVPAYLLVPKTVLNSGGKVSAILCLHGTNNVIGHGTVVGLGETPNRVYAKELAEQGFVTLAPNYPLLAKYQPDLSQLGWSSGTLKAVWDNQRGLDLLESLPYVDNTQGFGCIGHSLGGHNGLFTSVFDSRIRAVVTSCGFDSFSDYYGGKESVWMPEKGWCQTRYMPKLLDYRGRLQEIPFDFPEVLGAIAPRKVMVVAPLHDSNFVAASVDRAIASARSVYQLYGQPNHLMLEHPECPHDFPTEMRELAYALFKKEFKFASSANSKTATAPDLIVHHAQLLTVDDAFSIREAMAIRDEKIVAVGSNDEMLKLAGVETTLLDCQGKTVLPGLIDSHVHATGASTYEFDHPVPTMETIEDVLKYIGSRAEVLDDGEWIIVQQVFVTRLRDQRFPTRDELDRVAPNHPVVFRTGPDAALNSLALKLSQIDRNFVMPEGKTGKVEFDPQTGEPTGIIRSSGELIKPKSPIRKPSQEEEILQLKKLLADYNSVGITSVSDRNASNDGLQLYQKLRERNDLTCRVYLYYGVNASESLKQIEEKINRAVSHPLHQENRELWLRGVKVFLDGGMLTGSAFMKEPWGVSQIYGISDPNYRGIRYIDPEKLYQISKLVLRNNLQMTAHAVGDGSVQALVDTYAQINQDDFPIRGKRPCVTHCNFMTESAIATMSQLDIVADLQPAWLWLDGLTLTKQFGEERLRLFQPYRTLFDKQVKVGGGSDHMQKIGSFRSINPYNPFLGMGIAIQREPQRASKALHPSQSLSREEAIRLYTINNAYLTFEENFKGSLEVGKLADFIVIESDILQCDIDSIKDIQVSKTFLGGKSVYSKSY